jgi:hypothetical protein
MSPRHSSANGERAKNPEYRFNSKTPPIFGGVFLFPIGAQYRLRGSDGRSERKEDGTGGGVFDAVAGGVVEVEEERLGDDAGAGHRGDESGLAETEREASRASRTSINCAATLTAIS